MFKIPLIIMSSIPISVIFGDKVNAWWFHNNGFNVEFWDISPIYFSKERLDGYYSGSTDYKYIGPNHKTFYNKGLLFKAMSLLQNNTAIYYLSRTIYKLTDDDDILNYLYNKKLNLYFQVFTIFNEPSNLIDKIKNKIRTTKHRILNRNIYPTACFGSGLKTKLAIKEIYSETQFVSIPSPRIYWERQDRVLDYDYIVFVDESIGYEPDAKLLNLTSCTNLEGYHTRLNNLFDNIEKWTGLPIIVGASGKYKYVYNPFNREMIYKKTFALIEHASLVIGHTSDALLHNVKCKKPMLLLSDIDFTKVKKDGFKALIISSINKIYLSNGFKQEDLESISLNKDDEYDIIERNYFREYGIDKDYKKIMAETFKKFYKINLEK